MNEDLKEGGTYLLGVECDDWLGEIKVLRVTEKAYLLLNKITGSRWWQLKDKFHAHYTVLEVLS